MATYQAHRKLLWATRMNSRGCRVPGFLRGRWLNVFSFLFIPRAFSRFRRDPPIRHYPDIRPYPGVGRSQSLDVTWERHSEPGINTAASPIKALTLLWHTTALLWDSDCCVPWCLGKARRDACFPRFRLATPPGFQANHIPQGSLVAS